MEDSPHRNDNREEEEAKEEAWTAAFKDSFQQVQMVLDRNRVLIQQVNQNHRSKIAGNMVKNVALIQEINDNISKVVSLYSHLSSHLFTIFHHRNHPATANNHPPHSN